MTQQTYQILSLLAGAATWATAAIALMTLLSIRSQHRAAHRPQLTPTTQDIYARCGSKSRGAPNYWTESTPEEAAEGSSSQPTPSREGTLPDRYGVSLFNLGAGAAKDISIEWKFAIGDIVRQTNQLSQRSFAESYFQHDTSKQTLSLEAKTGLRATYFLKNDLHSRHDYILPCSIENKGHKVFLPGSYIDLVSSYLYLACTRFRRHRVRCFDGTGGVSWRDGSLHGSSSLRRFG